MYIIAIFVGSVNQLSSVNSISHQVINFRSSENLYGESIKVFAIVWDPLVLKSNLISFQLCYYQGPVEFRLMIGLV